MVDFNQFMSIALEKCAPSGQGTQQRRQAVFSAFVDVWNKSKDRIREMDEEEAREAIRCP